MQLHLNQHALERLGSSCSLYIGPGLPGLLGLSIAAKSADEAEVRRASRISVALALLTCVPLPAEGTFMRDFFSEELVKSIDAMSRAQVGPAPASC